MDLISIKNLTKRYGRRVGVDRLDLNVPQGIVFGFLGPNGSGKTTTIRVLMGLLRPSGGSARIGGLDTWRRSHVVKRDVGYLPGDLRLYPWLTARMAFRIVGRIRERDLTQAALKLADEFALELDVRVRNMSRGTRQKLGLVLALAHDPKVLILDEPTASLDPLVQDRLKDRLCELARGGVTVFFSSHSLSEVQHVCDRVAMLREGRLVADESLEDLRARAMRIINIRWQRGREVQSATAPAFLDVQRAHDDRWTCTLTGSVGDLIRWLADKPVEDLTIGQPDLDSLFRQYYETGTSEP